MRRVFISVSWLDICLRNSKSQDKGVPPVNDLVAEKTGMAKTMSFYDNVIQVADLVLHDSPRAGEWLKSSLSYCGYRTTIVGVSKVSSQRINRWAESSSITQSSASNHLVSSGKESSDKVRKDRSLVAS